ncbi:M3 family metallopeptidase [Salaquimonas pukyongi]|uniref:M3 family metallopeptidase n=1 Tax=Salaquimonas pukyongi TaxID=2712698 RepID=UPI00096B68FC|nr:M3 family metallopeptidase [Salaquimonas pukyongi]
MARKKQLFKDVNPEILCWSGKYDLPRFEKIANSDFAPAFEAAMKAGLEEIDVIAGQKKKPTFKNTIIALEKAEDALNRVSALFWNRAGAHTDDVIQAVERDITPKLSRYSSKIAMNAKLFKRIDALWERRKHLKLSTEEERVLERYWKGYVKSGAKLPRAEQKALAEINEQLASLGTRFGQNLLADEAGWHMEVGENALPALPGFLKQAMAAAAEERGMEGKHVVTLARSIIEPFLTFCDVRELREQAFKAWAARGENGGKTDNREIIEKILALRDRKAKLLGYENYAALKLDDTMAKTPQAVNELLESVWEKALAKAKEEENELAALVAAEGKNHPVAPWDWRHYAEKLRAQKFDFSESELKPYFQLEQVIAACFDVAGRLFGITFKERKGVTAYHPDVRVFTVHNKKGKRIATFLGDYFARPSKRSGAWMSSFQQQHKLKREDGKKGQKPVIYNVMNFAKGDPALLSLDDARTLFHEFGHALHGMLSDVTYPSVSGTAVSRDFVELPSQLFEHWLMVPELLAKYAVHAETGDPIPEALIAKVKAAETFNAGFETVEFTASALIDMAYHTAGKVADPLGFEREQLKKLNMPDSIIMRHRSPHFAHVFSGDGYSAGYYSYMWSEVLDADAFRAFAEKGDPFDRKTAKKLKKHIYSAGGSVDPEETYKAFRGKLPSPEAMLQGRGLI